MNQHIIEAKISEIQLGSRHRKDMGDMEALAQCMEETGLLQPIGITPDYELVFGERRLRAYRDVLGRDTIPARIVDVQSVLHGQLTENTMRKDFTPSELVAIVDALRSFTHGGDRRSDQARKCDDETLTVDEAAKRVGLGGKDGYSRAKAVVEKGVPELVEAMDRGAVSVSAAAVLADASPDEQRACISKPINGEKMEGRGVLKWLGRIRWEEERKAILQRQLLMPKTADAIRLYHCPFQQLEQTAGVAPESVQLICTDIPYGKGFLPEVSELADFAGRVLVPGGLFVTHCGQYWLPEVISALATTLRYRWVIASVWELVANVVHLDQKQRITSKWKPILIFSKGDLRKLGPWSDVSHVEESEKDWHEWQQPLAEVKKLVDDLSQPGDLVVDPCGGGFTTAIACHLLGRRFVGCDIDKAAVLKGQERLALEAATATAA